MIFNFSVQTLTRVFVLSSMPQVKHEMAFFRPYFLPVTLTLSSGMIHGTSFTRTDDSLRHITYSLRRRNVLRVVYLFILSFPCLLCRFNPLSPFSIVISPLCTLLPHHHKLKENRRVRIKELLRRKTEKKSVKGLEKERKKINK